MVGDHHQPEIYPRSLHLRRKAELLERSCILHERSLGVKTAVYLHILAALGYAQRASIPGHSANVRRRLTIIYGWYFSKEMVGLHLLIDLSVDARRDFGRDRHLE